MQFLIAFLQSSLIVPLALLPIINPLGNAPIFLSITRGNEPIAQQMARQVAINTWFILVLSILIGSYVLQFFGISLPIVRMGGGLLVASTAWRLLNTEDEDAVRVAIAGEAQQISRDEVRKRSFVPMTFPLTAGPGSIAASIAIGTRAPDSPTLYLMGVIVAAVGAALTAAVIYVCYRYASTLLNKLGDMGVVVMTRFLAFILLCIGIDMMWTGWAELNQLAP